MASIHEARLRWLFRAAAFLTESGAEPVSGLVLPDGDHFPDRFDGSPASVQRLMERMLLHAGLADIPVEVQVVAPEGESAKSCKSGGSCSAPVLAALARQRVVSTYQGYAVAVSPGEIGHPTALTTAFARAASSIFLAEAELQQEIEARELEGFVDVAGALLGFGVLLANGAHIAHKGCSGVTIQRATALPLDEIATALALACRLHGFGDRAARRGLDAEPQRAFDDAAALLDANAGLVGLVKNDRAAIDADGYRVLPPGGWLSRLFGGGRTKPGAVPTDDEMAQIAADVVPAANRDPEKARRMAALRELVDETLE